MAQGGVLDREGVLPLFQELEVQPCPALHEDPHLEAFLRQVIAEQHLEESFFVVDLGKILQQHQLWVKRLPQVHPHYAVKCNPSPAVLRTLASLGCSFDCASKTEIQQVLALPSVHAEDIIFANPCKLRSHLVYAREVGVKRMTFDSELELHKVADIFPEAELLLRIVTDDSASMCAFSAKFGAHPQDVEPLLQTAHSLGLRIVGVSFHVGSGCGDAEAYYKAVRDAHSIFQMAPQYGMHMSVLDVGGGFPGGDGEPNSKSVSFEDTAYALNRAIEEFFPASSGVSLISEPGRFFVAESHILACNIYAKKMVHRQVATEIKEGGGHRDEDVVVVTAAEEDSCGKEVFDMDEFADLEGTSPMQRVTTVENPSQQHNVYYIDDGVYQSFNCIFFDHMTPTPIPLRVASVARDFASETLLPSKLFGPTCDGIDVVTPSARLPDLDCGDWFFFRGMGAYTVAASSSFNGFTPRPMVHCSSVLEQPHGHHHHDSVEECVDSWVHLSSSMCKVAEQSLELFRRKQVLVEKEKEEESDLDMDLHAPPQSDIVAKKGPLFEDTSRTRSQSSSLPCTSSFHHFFMGQKSAIPSVLR